MLCFLDTNILVYMFDSDSAEKKQKAQLLFERLVKERSVVVSTQVLNEFYVTVTRKLETPLSSEDAETVVRNLSQFLVVQTDTELILSSIALSRADQISFWDALIVRAAQNTGAAILYSEDMQDGRMFNNLQVVNPFLL